MRRLLQTSTTAVLLLFATVGCGGGGEETAPGVWVLSQETETLSKIDPESNEITATIDVGAFPTQIIPLEGALWVANATDGTVSRINPQKLSVAAQIDLAGSARGLAVGDGRLWAADDEGVSPIDPATNELGEALPVGKADTTALAFADGSLWVATSIPQQVLRVDPSTGDIQATIKDTGQVLEFLVVGDQVWGTTFDGKTG